MARGKSKKKGVFSKIAKYFRECKGEIKKISWPTVRQTTRNFGVVILVMIIMGLFIYGLDRGLFALLNLVMETSGI